MHVKVPPRSIQTNHQLGEYVLDFFLHFSNKKIISKHLENRILFVAGSVPAKKFICHLKRDHVKRKASSSNHYFSGDMPAFVEGKSI